MTLRKKAPKRDSGTRSRVSKGPARDAQHLAKVRTHPCLVCKGDPAVFVIHAHHCRAIGPKTMGKRVSDYLTTPLCTLCHARLHRHNEKYYWPARGIDPAAWISRFSEAGRKAIEALQGTGT